ncbi:ABC transporter substrate-binding protein [Paenibacillus oceani]|uniref:Extracellular solute-binding protein n=1 Tax=Paenibacillus oceani TaxID=2772510 RepID=A0A927C745_9BACL|nr:extracellular solute-binding protein [Paenibacillus oceani]MBD2860741.1 extracellular solute-binding protein [Paenibacillus oceani]
MKELWKPLFVMGIAATISIGCASEKSGITQTIEESPEPVTLKMYTLAQSFSDEDFKRLVLDPVQRKYPHIHIELMVEPNDYSGAGLEKFIIAGNVPDLIYANTQNIGGYSGDLQAIIDLNGPIKQYQYELDRLNSEAINSIKSYGKNGELFGIPFSINGAGLYYNKDIFDKFGVPYPKDGSTWDDILELGKRLARTDGEVIYKPLGIAGFTHLATSLSLPYIDTTTGKASFATEGWKRAAEVFKMIKELPQNKFNGSPDTFFMAKQELAMYATYDNVILFLEQLQSSGKALNFDIASYPNFQEKRGIGLGFDAKVLLVSSKTKHVKEALQVMASMTSDEVQMMVTRSGRISALKDARFKENFGKDLVALQGKNVPALFNNVQAFKPPVTKEVSAVTKIINAAAKEIEDGKDINTALREADEKANKELQALRN